jgi:helix-turn-helix protein
MEQRQTTIEMSDEWLQAFFEDSEKAQQNDDESEPEIKTQEQIYSYPDGTVYMGHDTPERQGGMR